MIRSKHAIFIVTALLIGAATPNAYAVQPDEILPDPAMEATARDISAELRCLVCQNQSIDDSDAPLARDLRLLVRERLKAGDNKEQVFEFVVARYGEFVLLRPQFNSQTLLLWLAPLLLFGAGIFAAYRLFSSTRGPIETNPEHKLSNAEEKELQRILGRSKK